MTTKTEAAMPIVRIPNFDLGDELKGYYVDENPVATHMLNALHIIFPPGEQLFIRSVKYFVKELKEMPELKKRVKAFIGQEKQHQIQHEALWETMDELGLEASGFADWYQNNAYENGIEGFLKKILPERTFHEISLAVTAALEHYTATMAEFALEDDKNLFDKLPPKMTELLGWHAAEEIEHKSVAFDLLEEVNDSYALRVAGFVIGSAVLSFYASVGTSYFAIKDKETSFIDMIAASLSGGGGVDRMIAKVIPDLFHYFRPDFHPTDMENDHLAEAFLKTTNIDVA